MKPSDEAVATIADWLRSAFPNHEVDAVLIGERDIVLFTAYKLVPHSPRYELEVSYEAFEDYQAAEIVNDLVVRCASESLHRSDAVRLIYTHRRQLLKTDRQSESPRCIIR